MSRPIPLLAALIALLGLGAAQAQSAQDAWQLDVIVFERNLASSGYEREARQFRRIDWPALLDIDAPEVNSEPGALPPMHVIDAARAQGILIRSGQQSSLDAAAGKLARASSYAVLAHHSLRFASKTRTPRIKLHDGLALRLAARDTRAESGSLLDYWSSAPDLEAPVDTERLYGWMQLDHDFHPILKLDISLNVPMSRITPYQVDPDGRREYFRDQILQFRLIRASAC